MTKGRTDLDLTPAQRQSRDFMAALFAQAQDEGIDSPFKNLKPDYIGLQDTPARGPGLVYRVAVNRRESRVVLTNKKGRWTGALAVLLENRQKIDEAFAAADLPQQLEWSKEVTAGRWVIRYAVGVNYQGRARQNEDARTQPGFGPDEARVRPLPPDNGSTARSGLVG